MICVMDAMMKELFIKVDLTDIESAVTRICLKTATESRRRVSAENLLK